MLTGTTRESRRVNSSQENAPPTVDSWLFSTIQLCTLGGAVSLPQSKCISLQQSLRSCTDTAWIQTQIQPGFSIFSRRVMETFQETQLIVSNVGQRISNLTEFEEEEKQSILKMAQERC